MPELIDWSCPAPDYALCLEVILAIGLPWLAIATVAGAVAPWTGLWGVIDGLALWLPLTIRRYAKQSG